MSITAESIREFFFFALAWLAGSVLFVGGIGLATEMPLSSIPMFVGSAFTLPPVRSWASKKTGWRIPQNVRAGIYIGLMIALASVMSWETVQQARAAKALHAEAAAEAAIQNRARLEREYVQRRDTIFAEIRTAMEKEEFAAAVAIVDRYRAVAQGGLDQLREEISVAQAAASTRDEERRLVEEARGIPASNIRKNRGIYGRLVALDPDNLRYKERFDHYNALVQREERGRRAQLEAWGAQPKASDWDGTYPEVKDHLKRVMNDPSSLDMDGCTQVYQAAGKGWLVGCDYRGKNAFGAVVRESKWFIIRHGQVVETAEASAYSVR